MTTVSIPWLVVDPSQTDVSDTTVMLRLVDARGLPLIGLHTVDGAPITAYADYTRDPETEALELELTPQDAIALPDGGASYYTLTVRGAHRQQTWRFQVPDSGETLPLIDLIGAAAIEPGSILASRLLPTDAEDNQVAYWDAASGRWVAGFISGVLPENIDGGTP